MCRGAPALIGEALRQEWRLMMRLPCEMFQGRNSIVQSFTAPASPPVAGRSRKSGEHRRSPDGLDSARIRRREVEFNNGFRLTLSSARLPDKANGIIELESVRDQSIGCVSHTSMHEKRLLVHGAPNCRLGIHWTIGA